MSDRPFKIKHCVKCKHAFWEGPDYSVGIMGPTLEDCDMDVCPCGNKWEDYASDEDLVDWDGAEI